LGISIYDRARDAVLPLGDLLKSIINKKDDINAITYTSPRIAVVKDPKLLKVVDTINVNEAYIKNLPGNNYYRMSNHLIEAAAYPSLMSRLDNALASFHYWVSKRLGGRGEPPSNADLLHCLEVLLIHEVPNFLLLFVYR
jgi:hypothetical protein